MFQQGDRASTDVFLAADHDRQACFSGADIAARDGGVNALDVFLRRRCGNFDRQRWLAGRHVDEDIALLAAGECALFAQHHRANIGWKTDDGKNDVRLFRDRLGTLCPMCALGNQRLGLGFGARIDGHRKAGVHQMAAHARPHHAGSDPAKFRFACCNLHHGYFYYGLLTSFRI